MNMKLKGRQKGQTKKTTVIKDELIHPYQIIIDEDQLILLNVEKNKPVGYFNSLEKVIRKIIKLNMVNQEKTYTLVGFLESYNNIKKELLEPFKIL